MTTGFVYDDRFLEHDTGPGHPERADRLRAIIRRLQTTGLIDQLKLIDVPPADVRWIQQIHEPAYIRRVQEACTNDRPYIDAPDSTISADSYDVALLAVGGMLAAADAIMGGQVDNAFCAVRPPGHHAERDRSMGFCLFNSIAIAAQYVLQRHGRGRVAIVDFDVHHGNGTQHSFEDRAEVLFISLHEDPRILYPGTGFANEIGRGEGRGYTLNVPLPAGSGDMAYQEAMNNQVLPRLEEFAPEMLLVSAGFDASAADPLAHQTMTPQGFAWITRQLNAIAERFCHGRLLATLEGGYDLTSLADCVEAHLRVLMGQ